jgi:hypothetical protein
MFCQAEAMVRLSDETLAQIRSEGFALVEGFLDDEELAAARTALWQEFPHPDDYFADPGAHADLVATQFSGIRYPPFASWDLNRLSFHPDLVDAAERFCGTTDLQLYKVELWPKYSGTVDYDQPLHRDFSNHSLVVPRADGRWPQLTTFLLLSDVSEDDGPTRAVSRTDGQDRPLWPNRLQPGDLADREVAITGPAGSLFLYTTDVLHRGSAMVGPQRSRFMLLSDYSVRGNPWMGKMSWPDRANKPGWADMLSRATVRERDLFGFPRPGHEYWNEQTLRDVAVRYPDMDLSPYSAAATGGPSHQPPTP